MKTIRNYVDIIKEEYLKEDVFYVADLLELEDEDTEVTFEIFRVIRIDDVKREAMVIDFEYSKDEDLVLKWEAEADYSKIRQMDLNDKDDLNDLIIIVDDFLIYDFLVTELYNYKGLIGW